MKKHFNSLAKEVKTMITVYVLVTFADESGVHKAGTICQVKSEDFDPRFMKKIDNPGGDSYTKEETNELLSHKQDTLTAGQNITIEDDTISAKDDIGDTVTVTQIQSTGTKIATIKVNETDTDIYAPAGGSGLDEEVIADAFDTVGHEVPATGTLYNVGDIVKKSSSWYECSTACESGPFDSSKWTSINVTSFTSTGAGNTINAGEYAFISNKSKLYRNKNQWGTSYFDPANVDTNNFEEVAYTNYSTTVYVPPHTEYASYSAGDFVMYDGALYKCTGSTSGGTFDPAKWSETQVMDEIPSGGGGGGVTVLDIDIDPASLISSDGTCTISLGGIAQTAAQVEALIAAGIVQLCSSVSGLTYTINEMYYEAGSNSVTFGLYVWESSNSKFIYLTISRDDSSAPGGNVVWNWYKYTPQ